MENYLSKIIVDTCFHIHVGLGPGLLESVYEEVLYYELSQQGYNVKRQHSIPIIWENIEMKQGFRADLIVEDSVLIEIKSVSK
jgi:GxxExxY protein